VWEQAAAINLLRGQQRFIALPQCRDRPPNNSVLTSSVLRFRATLAAPPGMKFSSLESTTGTGASGEMRPTSPDEMIQHGIADDDARFSPRRKNFPVPGLK